MEVQLSTFSLVSANAVLNNFISSNIFFSTFLSKELLPVKNENILICPISVQLIMALAQRGAKDDTAQEIRTCLKLPTEIREIDYAVKEVLVNLKTHQISDLHTSNKIYLQQNISIKKDFQKISKAIYQTVLEAVNFSDPAKATEIINKWVNNKTGNVKNLIESSKLDSNVKMVLLNALHFQGYWRKPFLRAITSKNTFFKTAKNTTKVDMMRNVDLYNYCDCKELNAQFLEIPLQSDDVFMIIVLPKDKGGLASLEKQIDRFFVIAEFTQERVDVSLPKFSFESVIDLKEILKKIGVKVAFTKNANFSGIAGDKGNIYINEVLQKSCIDVNEDGLGVAVTSNMTLAATSSRFPPNCYLFKADHPFIFYIKGKDVIYFTGKVTDPV